MHGLRQKEWQMFKGKVSAVGRKLKTMQAEYDLWAPHIYTSQKAVLDNLPVSAVEKLSSMCTSELRGAASGQVNLSKLGQRIVENEALEQHRLQYLKAADPQDTSTWSWLTAAILVKVNEHHTQCGRQYFQISDNFISKAPQKRHMRTCWRRGLGKRAIGACA